MRLGVMTTSLLQHDFEAGLDRVRELGIDAIEPGCGGFHPKRYCDPARLLADDRAFERWHDAVASRSLQISALALHGAPLSPDPAEAAAYAAELRDACRLAERIGVTRITLLAGLPEGAPGDRTPCWVTTPFPPYNADAIAYQWERRLIPYWREHGAIAEAHGCQLCFEMCFSDMVHNPSTLLRLRAEVGDVVACNFDPSHLLWQQIDPAEAAGVLGNAIAHVHAKDVRLHPPEVRVNGVLDPKPFAEAGRRAWLFRTVGYGHGVDTWRELVTALRLAGYDDVLSIEHEDDLIDPDEGLEKAATLLCEALVVRSASSTWWSGRKAAP
jgi:sugar phosphate isomerase/epimerase